MSRDKTDRKQKTVLNDFHAPYVQKLIEEMGLNHLKRPKRKWLSPGRHTIRYSKVSEAHKKSLQWRKKQHTAKVRTRDRCNT